MNQLPFRQDLTTKFISAVNKLSDKVLIEVVVAFANTEGGKLYLGVEYDGHVTGVHEKHQDITNLGAFIFNKRYHL